jgi:hypothetical protein
MLASTFTPEVIPVIYTVLDTYILSRLASSISLNEKLFGVVSEMLS